MVYFLINCLSGFSVLKKSTKLYISAWIGINKPGSYNSKHVHPTSHLSGVFWIKVPKNSGSIMFHSPEIFNRFQELDCYTDEFCYDSNCYMTHDFTPSEGKILIFPSSLEHEVKKNESNEDRISVSFNMRL